MNDVINGLFEMFGAVFLSLHCYRLYQDKRVRGVSVLPFVFFTSWGYWNLWFYPSLEQWWSFYGGLAVVSVNTFYLGMLWQYRKN